MLPVVIRSAEVVLLLVPAGLREAALALGAPRWRVVTRIVLPTAAAGPGHRRRCSPSRAATGETAPLLFTTGGDARDHVQPQTADESLPVQIYTDVTSPTPSS